MNFLPRPVEPDRVVPAGEDRQAVGGGGVAAAESNRVRAVVVCYGVDAVDRVDVAVVLLEVALGVVDRDPPPGVDRQVAEGDGVDGAAVVALGNRERVV